MAEEPSLSYYLPIAGGRIIGFIPFPRVLVLCEMQSVSSRIWTRIAVLISYGDNDYTTGTSKTWNYEVATESFRFFCLRVYQPSCVIYCQCHPCKKQQWYYVISCFPKRITLKVNVIGWLEFEFTLFEVKIPHFNHYATGTFLLGDSKKPLRFKTFFSVYSESLED